MTFAQFVGQIIGFLNLVVTLFIGIILALFFWGAVRFLYKVGDPHEKMVDKRFLVWGLVGLFLAVSVFGVLRVLCYSFFGDQNCRVGWHQGGGSGSP